jgi:hypothetical protein
MCWLLEWARALILDSLNHMISTASSPPQGSELLGGIWKPLPPETAFWYVLAASLSHVTSAAPPPHKEMNCWVRPKSSESRLSISQEFHSLLLSIGMGSVSIENSMQSDQVSHFSPSQCRTQCSVCFPSQLFDTCGGHLEAWSITATGTQTIVWGCLWNKWKPACPTVCKTPCRQQ